MRVKDRFPALNQAVYQKPLVYLDSAATSQKPQSVLDAMNRFYQQDNANVHRGVHALSMRADKAYEAVRSQVRQFIHAASTEEIIFTKGTTESINLLATCLGESLLEPGDEILITEMEHHANIVPWQMLCERKKTLLKVVPVQDDGTLDLQAYHRLLTPRTKIVSMTHASNVLGTLNPIKKMIDAAHLNGSLVCIDAAQTIHHLSIDVQALDCDFLVFSGHKMYGPTGVGVLYGKKNLLDLLPPYQGGGAMISEVSFDQTTFNQLPYKFEAGTPNIAGVIGLGAAIDFILEIGLEHITNYESQLSDYLLNSLQAIPGLRVIGTSPDRVGVVSFVMDGIHAHDMATLLDRQGVAIRAGHHCAMPLMKRYGLAATSRASLAVYNTVDDVDALVSAIHASIEVFS